MERGYYISIEEMQSMNSESLEMLLAEIDGKNQRVFQSIGRIYAILPEENAKRLSEKYVVEPEPEKKVWI